MTNVIVAFSREEDAKNIKNILVRNGFMVAAVDSRKLGYHITAFVSLDVSSADKIRFYEDMESVPNVLECNCVTGEYSMLVKVAFPSTMELDLFIGQLQKYGKTSTQIVFSTPVGPRYMDVMAELGEKE